MTSPEDQLIGKTLAELMKNGERANREMVGKRVEILVEGPSKSDPTRFTGRTRDHRIVVYPVAAAQRAGAAEERTGVLVEVEIEGSTALTLRGRRTDTLAR